MAKKTILIVAAMCIFSLFCEICCFAADNNSINLGNTVSETMNKAGKSMENLKDDMFSGDMMTEGKDAMDKGERNIENGARSVEDGVVNTTKLDNYRTNDYNAVRTETNMPNTEVGGMTTTTWMWVILALSAIIIIAAVWYYATQNNGRD